jgi:hypothetical protein
MRSIAYVLCTEHNCTQRHITKLVSRSYMFTDVRVQLRNATVDCMVQNYCDKCQQYCCWWCLRTSCCLRNNDTETQSELRVSTIHARATVPSLARPSLSGVLHRRACPSKHMQSARLRRVSDTFMLQPANSACKLPNYKSSTAACVDVQ